MAGPSVALTTATGPTAVWRHTAIGEGRMHPQMASRNEVQDFLRQRRRRIQCAVHGLHGFRAGDLRRLPGGNFQQRPLQRIHPRRIRMRLLRPHRPLPRDPGRQGLPRQELHGEEGDPARSIADIVADKFFFGAAVVTVKVADVAPAATTTLPGVEASEEFELPSVTRAPPPGAGVDSVTVPVDVLPPDTVAGLRASEVSAAGAAGFTVNVVVLVTPL